MDIRCTNNSQGLFQEGGEGRQAPPPWRSQVGRGGVGNAPLRFFRKRYKRKYLFSIHKHTNQIYCFILYSFSPFSISKTLPSQAEILKPPLIKVSPPTPPPQPSNLTPFLREKYPIFSYFPSNICKSWIYFCHTIYIWWKINFLVFFYLTSLLCIIFLCYYVRMPCPVPWFFKIWEILLEVSIERGLPLPPPCFQRWPFINNLSNIDYWNTLKLNNHYL